MESLKQTPLLVNAYIQQEKYENAYQATQSLASRWQ